jgi:hypothetical protein
MAEITVEKTEISISRGSIARVGSYVCPGWPAKQERTIQAETFCKHNDILIKREEKMYG